MNYDWLKDVIEPPMVRIAAVHLGLQETPGAGDNSVILGMAEAVEKVRPGLGYTHDSVPWCGLFMAYVAMHAGYDFPDRPLWALNWAGFGERVTVPALGDVLTFTRYDGKGKFIGGHVALYVGEDDTHFHVLGGNQSDAVNVMRIEKGRLHQARRPKFEHLPPTVKPIRLAADGAVSTNEA